MTDNPSIQEVLLQALQFGADSPQQPDDGFDPATEFAAFFNQHLDNNSQESE